MKSKFSWIPFVPLTVAAVFFKFVSLMYAGSEGSAVFGLSPFWCEYISLFCVAGIFLLTILCCVCDRKISPYYAARRNIGAGIFGILIALALSYEGCSSVYAYTLGADLDILGVIETAFLILGAIAFIVMGLSHFTGRSSGRGALFFMMPACLCSVRLIRIFVGFTTISVTMADVSLLICYILAALFLFNLAVLLSLTQAKNVVKWCFIYGFPAVAVLIAYSVGNLYFNFNFDDITANIGLAEIALLALYILSFLIEMTAFVKTRDLVTVVDSEADIEEEHEEYQEIPDEEDLPPIITGVVDAQEIAQPASSYLTTADTSDYIYQSMPADEQKERESISYMDSNVGSIDEYITEKSEELEPPEDEEENEQKYNSRLDEIDRLILEISEEEFQ